MDASPLLALERLRRTSARTLAKAAVRELLERDVVRLQPFGPAGRQRTGQTDGSASQRDLAAAGHVEQETRRVLGLVPRSTWRRTPAGTTRSRAGVRSARRTRPTRGRPSVWSAVTAPTVVAAGPTTSTAASTRRSTAGPTAATAAAAATDATDG